jgi:hypothetical protein
MRFFLALAIVFLFFSCMNSGLKKTKKKYCGLEMSSADAFEKYGQDTGYSYSATDMELHSEVSEIAQEVGGDSIIIETFFFLRNSAELGIMLVGPDDPVLIKQMSCGIIKRRFKNKIPEQRYILYFSEEGDNLLLSAVKTKQEP